MRTRGFGLKVFGVLFVILLSFGLCWGQTPPTMLVVVRASDDSLWKMTCDEVACSPFASFPGMFRYQPTVAWDETAQEWVLVGTASDNSIWMATFAKNGNFNNDWHTLPGRTPSPAGIAGGPVVPRTITVTCPGQSLQVAVDAAEPGAVINVTGTCTENVVIRQEKNRLTLDGQDVATINGSSGNMISVLGKEIVIKNFTISGGLTGISLSKNASAVINHNIIQNLQQWGIAVVLESSAVITNNTIQNNVAGGIYVGETSTARIGFNSTFDSAPSPNTIQYNGSGISISRGSSARIVSNTIASNTNNGIDVTRVSQSDIAGNTINNNGGHGINVYTNSGIELGENNPGTNFLYQPNTTTVGNNNGLYGINCGMGAYVRGHLGSSNQIMGSSGQTTDPWPGSCPQSLVTP